MSATSPRVHSNNPGSYGSSLLYHQRGAQGPPNNRGGNTLSRFPGQKQLQDTRYGKGHSVSGRTGADSGQALFTPQYVKQGGGEGLKESGIDRTLRKSLKMY